MERLSLTPAWELAPSTPVETCPLTPAGGLDPLTHMCISVSPKYVFELWQEHAFFGYQFLNGVILVVMRKCTSLPENFPVMEELVAGSLGEGTTLRDELKIRRSY
ncbi:unnamed protein product [Caretta caretta]